MTDEVARALAALSDEELLGVVNDALAQRRGEEPAVTPDVELELELELRTTLDPNYGLPPEAATETGFTLPPALDPPDPDADPGAADFAAILAQLLGTSDDQPSEPPQPPMARAPRPDRSQGSSSVSQPPAGRSFEELLADVRADGQGNWTHPGH